MIFLFLTSFRYKPHEHELRGFPREGEESSLGSSHIRKGLTHGNPKEVSGVADWTIPVTEKELAEGLASGPVTCVQGPAGRRVPASLILCRSNLKFLLTSHAALVSTN